MASYAGRPERQDSLEFVVSAQIRAHNSLRHGFKLKTKPPTNKPQVTSIWAKKISELLPGGHLLGQQVCSLAGAMRSSNPQCGKFLLSVAEMNPWKRWWGDACPLLSGRGLAEDGDSVMEGTHSQSGNKNLCPHKPYTGVFESPGCSPTITQSFTW